MSRGWVTSHFDVKRDYNPGTGEQTNVIVENTTDRPWNERQFMRAIESSAWAEAVDDGLNVFDMSNLWGARLSERVIKPGPWLATV